MPALRLIDGEAAPGPGQHDEAAATELVTCICGDAWWQLEATLDLPGAVSLQQDGTVAGVMGQLVCVSCGEARGAGQVLEG